MMGSNRIAAVALLALLPSTGWAGDMQLGAMGSVEYDSNIGRTETNEKDDFVFRVSPHVDFMEDEGHFTWNVGYLGAYERAIDYDLVDGFYHFVNADADWNLNDRTSFYTSNHFSYSETIDTVTSFDSPSQTASINTFTEPVYRYDGEVGVQHAFTPRLVGDVSGFFDLFNTDLPGRSNNLTFGGSGDLRYALTPLHDLGGGVTIAYQDFDESNGGGRPPLQTLYVNLFGLWDWEIDETTTLEVQAGPAFVDNNQDAPPSSQTVAVFPSSNGQYVINTASCPVEPGDPVLGPGQGILRPGCAFSAPFNDDDRDTLEGAGTTTVSFLGPPPGSLSDTSWTAFGSLALSKRWTPEILSTLSYSRSFDTASGVSGSAINDYVSLFTSWQITRLWSAGVRGDFSRRKSTSPIRQDSFILENTTLGCVGCSLIIPYGRAVGLVSTVIDDALETNRWGVATRLARRITDNLVVSARYTYNQQSSKSGTVGTFSDFDDHIVTLAVEYDFDRWRLW